MCFDSLLYKHRISIRESLTFQGLPGVLQITAEPEYKEYSLIWKTGHKISKIWGEDSWDDSCTIVRTYIEFGLG